ncbi:hypothetical protein G7Y79_00006g019140 [Physcia stellaris]|nr:hypothetical protein G7Y79_00006g019140 [Physcia stellaris]
MDPDEKTFSFKQFVANGREYWDAMASGGQETRWLRMNDLTVWISNMMGIFENVDLDQGTERDDDGQENSLGWTESSESNPETVSDFRKAYNALNISGSKDANRNVRLDQDKAFKTDGKTQALGLPQVKFWSDIVWIVWASLAKTDTEASSLKYIFRHDIINEETIFVIEEIFGVSRRNFPDGEEWPGRKLVPNEESFWAVLGTPHGRGIAYLIRDHPNELPGKSIESINVFRGDKGVRQWHLLFTLDGPGNNPLDPSDFMPPSEEDSDSTSRTGEPDTASSSSFERFGDSTSYAERFKSCRSL